MPHECTNCGRVFADGSKEMLSGCPDCGGNKFQFKPAAAMEREQSPGDADERSPEAGGAPSEPTETRRDLSEDSTEWPDHGYGSAADTGTDDPSPDAADPEPATGDAPGTDPDATPADADHAVEPGDVEPTAPESDPTVDDSAEDPAQADARTDVVSPDEIAAATPEETQGTATPDAPATDAGDSPADSEGRVPEPRPDDRPDLEDLREELNEQFESIRIVAPGEYELNLMELYDRTEYIISLQEDGRYVIEVPDTWDTTPDPDET